MIKFGPAGNSDSFYAQGYKSTWQAPKWLKEMGLNAYEYSFGRGVNLSDEGAEKVRAEAEKHGIDANTYMNAVVAMYDIHSDYYLDGKIVDGKDLTAEQRKNLKYVRNSRRRKVEEYLNSVCTSYKDYLFLLGTEYSSITDDADYVSYFGK